MFTPKIESPEHIGLLNDFKQWLRLLGYSSLSIPTLCFSLSAFLLYQEGGGKISLAQLEVADAPMFIKRFAGTATRRTGKLPSTGYINKSIQSLKLFGKFIIKTGKSKVAFELEMLRKNVSKSTWLTLTEIKILYGAVPNSFLGVRDRAILAIYYGCGLRLNEGLCLEIKDIDRTRRIVHVRMGKMYKERLVPIAEKDFNDIVFYLDHVRPMILCGKNSPHLFITVRGGNRAGPSVMHLRINFLCENAGIDKSVSPHTLRRSIATHLFQNGMKLERIKQFLGHKSLDSTQLYTYPEIEESILDWEPFF